MALRHIVVTEEKNITMKPNDKTIGQNNATAMNGQAADGKTNGHAATKTNSARPASGPAGQQGRHHGHGVNRGGMSSGFRRAPLKAEDLKRGPVDPQLQPAILTRDSLQDGKLVVYPSHGVGRVMGIEERDLGGGASVELVVVSFETEKLTLRLPMEKAKKDGLRTLLSRGQMETVLNILKGRGKVKRIMWAKRAQEYEAKINSGDASLVAEVVRDLYRPPSKPEQSFSEKQLFQTALERLAREIAAIESIQLPEATQRLHSILDKNAL